MVDGDKFQTVKQLKTYTQQTLNIAPPVHELFKRLSYNNKITIQVSISVIYLRYMRQLLGSALGSRND
jgi:hypothetical protein